MKRIKIDKDELVGASRVTLCPYCTRKLSNSWSACCSEVGHGEPGLELTDGQLYLLSEIQPVKWEQDLHDEDRGY